LIYFAVTKDNIDLFEANVHLIDVTNQSHQILYPGGDLNCGGTYPESYVDAITTNFYKLTNSTIVFAATIGLTNMTCSSATGSSYRIQKSSTLNYNSVLWTKEFGGSQSEELKTVLETPTGFLLVGSSDSNISQDKTEDSRGLNDFWIIQTDSSGNIIWQKPSAAIKTMLWLRQFN